MPIASSSAIAQSGPGGCWMSQKIALVRGIGPGGAFGSQSSIPAIWAQFGSASSASGRIQPRRKRVRNALRESRIRLSVVHFG